MKLWFDDIRDPPLATRSEWTIARTVAEARRLLETGLVEEASLDHDIGCIIGPDGEPIVIGEYLRLNPDDQMLDHVDYYEGPVETGTDLVMWMVATGHWPKKKPVVHSANPEGAARMRALIDEHFGHPPVSFAPIGV